MLEDGVIERSTSEWASPLVIVRKLSGDLRICVEWRCGGLMVSALDSGTSAPDSSPCQGHCVVFLGKSLYSHGASLQAGV